MKINYGYLCQWIMFLPILLPILLIGGFVNGFLGILEIIKRDVIETIIK
ncbi:hypothetical protein [Emticicia aquatilis]|nr:hypothetical protein [Emticicia aquatilis]